MTRLEKAAAQLHALIWINMGSSDEWPIQIQCDEELQDRLIAALGELGDALEEVAPGSKPWPLPCLS